MKQCEKAQNEFLSSGLVASLAEMKKRNLPAWFNKNQKPSVSARKRMPCHKCGRFGHWMYQHEKDGTLTPGVSCFNSANKYILLLNSSSDSKYEKMELVETVIFVKLCLLIWLN